MAIRLSMIVRPLVWLAILGGVCVVLFIGLTSALDPRSFGTVERIRVGAYDGDVGALEWIAKERGYFDRVGLDVDLLPYPSGNAAVDALQRGEVDVATAADLVVAKRSFRERDLRVIADICRYWNKALVARKDRGIAEPADLKGKRIGVPLTSSAEHNLMVFLALQGLSADDVTIVDTPPAKFGERIAAGDIDAGLVWQPHALAMEKSLGDNAVKLMEGGTEAHLLLVASRKVLPGQTKPLTKLLKGLMLAEEWVQKNPAEAKAYLMKRFSLDAEYVELLWPRMQLGLSLPQEILEAMDSEARWLAKANGWETTPNYADTIHPQLLMALKPDAVGVFAK